MSTKVKPKQSQGQSTNQVQGQSQDHHEEHKLHATFIAVLAVGGFIVLSWLAIFFIFM
ncbi:cytochrome c oxidase subunit 2A [Alkalibacillus aidingensis]|uniref:cytochrome c oxidase subunit 2A n=1 Tax=Alkalibacillus aidingensis TaxID=2747607 RepID=UPI00166120D1|nr:cytochrome c oxidase subunit 2A [Alkalibacillus aidingensis]